MIPLYRHIIPTLLTFLVLSSCFAIDHSLMNGIVTAKWLWLEAALLPILLYVSLVLFRRKAMRPSLMDVAVLVLMGYLIANSLFYQRVSWDTIYKLLAALGLWLFIRLAINKRKGIKGTMVIYLLVVASQAAIGMLQIYGFLPSNHSRFPISGSFHNPGPFSGFMVSGLSLALGIYLFTRECARNWYGKVVERRRLTINGYTKVTAISLKLKVYAQAILEVVKQRNADVLMHYFSQVVLLLLLLVLLATRSRAAWLAAIVSCAWVSCQLGLWDSMLKQVRGQSSRFGVLGLRFRIQFPFPWAKVNTSFGLTKRLIISTTAIVLLFSSIYNLYKFKQGSADGRLLMWQVSLEMIKDKPLFGFGSGGFEAHYGDYQAEWFNSGKGTNEQELVAGTPDAPFNEFIRVGLEYGLVGVLIVTLVLCSVFCVRHLRPELKTQNSEQNTLFSEPPTQNPQMKTRNQQIGSDKFSIRTPLQSALLSILIFSFFSYPLDVAPIVVQIIILTALITNLKMSNNQQASFSQQPVSFNPDSNTQNLQVASQNPIHQAPNPNTILHFIMALALLTLIPVLGYHTYNQYKGYKHWKEAHMLYQHQIYNDAADEYRLAQNYFPDDGLLLQMYGKCLAMSVSNEQLLLNSGDSSAISEQWHKARGMLELATQYRSDPILYTTLGDTYKALGEYAKAERAYQHAWQMVPHKFYPGYLLVKLYNESEEQQKAVNVAKELYNKQVKVDSRAVDEIKTELKKLLQQDGDVNGYQLETN